jgi:hypothetical protein
MYLFGYGMIAFGVLGGLMYVLKPETRLHVGPWYKAVGSVVVLCAIGVVLLMMANERDGKIEQKVASTPQQNTASPSVVDGFKSFALSSMMLNTHIDKLKETVREKLQGQSRDDVLRAVSEVLFAQKQLRKEIDDTDSIVSGAFKSEDQRRAAHVVVSHLSQKLSALEASSGGLYGMASKQMPADDALRIIKESLIEYDRETEQYIAALRRLQSLSGG